MLSRRSLVRGAAASLGFAALPGCALLPPGATPTVPTAPLAGHRALETLASALSSDPPDATPAQLTLLSWARGVLADQFVATSWAAPTASATITPSAGPATLAAAVQALTAAAGEFTTQALDASAADPLIWASMAAWATTVGEHLPHPRAATEPVRNLLAPAAQDAGAAAQDALDAAAEALYGIQVAAGEPGLTAEEQDALRLRISWWQSLRDDLDTLVTGATPRPTPAPAWFAVAPPSDADSARRLAAGVQAATLPVLGRSFRYADPALRPRLAQALSGASADVPAWGGMLERWPGFPTA